MYPELSTLVDLHIVMYHWQARPSPLCLLIAGQVLLRELFGLDNLLSAINCLFISLPKQRSTLSHENMHAQSYEQEQ